MEQRNKTKQTRKYGNSNKVVIWMSFILIFTIPTIWLFLYLRFDLIKDKDISELISIITITTVSSFAPWLIFFKTRMGENHRIQEREEWMLSGIEYDSLLTKIEIIKKRKVDTINLRLRYSKADYERLISDCDEKIDELKEVLEYLSSPAARISTDKYLEFKVNRFHNFINWFQKLRLKSDVKDINKVDLWFSRDVSTRENNLFLNIFFKGLFNSELNKHYINSYIHRKKGLLLISFSNYDGRINDQNKFLRIQSDKLNTISRKFILLKLPKLSKMGINGEDYLSKFLYMVNFKDGQLIKRNFYFDETKEKRGETRNLMNKIEEFNNSIHNAKVIDFDEYLKIISKSNLRRKSLLNDFSYLFKDEEININLSLLNKSIRETSLQNISTFEMFEFIMAEIESANNFFIKYIYKDIFNRTFYLEARRKSILEKQDIFEKYDISDKEFINTIINDYKVLNENITFIVKEDIRKPSRNNDLIINYSKLGKLEFDPKSINASALDNLYNTRR